MDILLWILIGILFVLAYIGMVIPLIPDVPFMLVGFLLYQLFLTEKGLGATFWVSVILLTILLIIIEYVATGIAVKKSGGSTFSVFVSMLGLLLFSFILGPLGILIGPFLAVFVFEFIKRGKLTEAIKIALGTFIGLLSSILVKFALVTSLLIWFFNLV